MDVTRFCWSYLSEVSSLLFFSIPPLRSLFAPRHHPIIMSATVDASRPIHFAFHLASLRLSLHPSRQPPSHCFCILSSALIDFLVYISFFLSFYLFIFYFIFYFILFMYFSGRYIGEQQSFERSAHFPFGSSSPPDPRGLSRCRFSLFALVLARMSERG